MRFIITGMTSFGIWLLFAGVAMPTPWSTQYRAGLVGSLMLGCVVGLIYGAWQDTRKEDRHANAEKDAHRS